MNKSDAAEYLPLVQALAEGKTIQLKCYPGWYDDLTDPDFSRPVGDYRIKPEPLESFNNFYPDRICSHKTADEAKRRAVFDAIRIAVHMREVIE